MVKSSESMLKKTLAPVVMVVLFWIAMSSATTFYLQWLGRSQEQFFVEHMVALRAAESLQVLVWRLAAEFPADATGVADFQLKWNAASNQIAFERANLEHPPVTAQVASALAKLDSSLTAFRDCLRRVFDRGSNHQGPTSDAYDLAVERFQIIDCASRIAASASELLKTNEKIAEQHTSRMKKISRIVLLSRLTIMVVGPLIGILLGWRLASQLRHSISRIAVTLHGAGSSGDGDVGTVAIEASGDFQDIQQQAEQVAQRMRQVSHDLQIAQHEILQSERLAAVGELAAGVAHEIRNPLTSVKLLLQHAIRQATGPQLDEDKLRLILEEIGRMETTIQGLLDFSRPPKLNRVHHDLRQTLQRALNLLDARSRQQGIVIATQICDGPLTVDGDTEKLHQVLVNLLINAIEAMPEGGRLSITASAVPSPVQFTTTTSAGSVAVTEQRNAQIVIRDTGEGIDNDLLPRLFEPFATTKERGTGLGLAVSRRIVEEHRGSIHARNDPDGGAQFTLTIPMCSAD